MSESIADVTQTVLIVDDDPRMRAYIRDLLGTESGVRILGEARDGEEAIRLVQQLRPEVVLMDLGMPRMGGLDALRRTKREMPWTKVIMVTVHGEDAYRRAAPRPGRRRLHREEASPGRAAAHPPAHRMRRPAVQKPRILDESLAMPLRILLADDHQIMRQG